MTNFIDIALCEDGSVFELPAFSHVEKGDVLIYSDGWCVVTMSITLDKDSDALRLIQKMYTYPISRAEGKMHRIAFNWEEDNGHHAE